MKQQADIVYSGNDNATVATAAARNDTAASVPQPEDSVPVATDESQAVTVNHVAGATGNNDDDNDKDNIADNSDFPPLEARPHSPAATPYQQQVFPPASNMNVKALPPARALGWFQGHLDFDMFVSRLDCDTTSTQLKKHLSSFNIDGFFICL